MLCILERAFRQLCILESERRKDMENDVFNCVVEDVVLAMKQSLKIKGEEYSNGKDRLQNLKDTASLCHMEPEQVLFVLVSKHLIATRDAIFELPDNIRSEEFWLEKLGDMVNYYGPLLQACLRERGVL
jgi:hypothetical protein